ncbi:hypothetical protein ACA29_20605 [Lederbergia galactosidilytica]|uniref:Uncharacterized protein n=1 Tax=Lederbergia galactosidilytica TaxID=217031 RepID=A0A0Q9XZG1_9BACI|nr:hypothetical protein ACA29_20605 [Lederbergia galactosidilytica]
MWHIAGSLAFMQRFLTFPRSEKPYVRRFADTDLFEQIFYYVRRFADTDLFEQIFYKVLNEVTNRGLLSLDHEVGRPVIVAVDVRGFKKMSMQAMLTFAALNLMKLASWTWITPTMA